MSTVADNTMQIKIENPTVAAMGMGNRIKFARERMGISQTELADSVGIRQSSVADIESGETKKPRKPTLVAIAKYLKSDLGEEWIKTALEAEKTTENGEDSFDVLLDAKIRRIVQEEGSGEGLEEKIRKIVQDELNKHTSVYHPYDLEEELKVLTKKEKKELPLSSQKTK